MRIVLDTNVVMSALLWRGKPYLLLEAIRLRGDLQLVSSAVLLEELADVLTRPSATKRLALIGKTVHEVLADYVEVIESEQPARREPRGRAPRQTASATGAGNTNRPSVPRASPTR